MKEKKFTRISFKISTIFVKSNSTDKFRTELDPGMTLLPQVSELDINEQEKKIVKDPKFA